MPGGAQSDRANERERTGRQRETDHHRRRRPEQRAGRHEPARARIPRRRPPRPRAAASSTGPRGEASASRRTRARSRTRARARGRRARRPPDRRSATGTWIASTTSPITGNRLASTRDEHQREGDRERDRRHHVRRHRDDEAADLGPDVVAVRGTEDPARDLGAGDARRSPQSPPRGGVRARPTPRRGARRAAAPGPARVSGTAVTSPSDEALMPTTAAAIRYA